MACISAHQTLFLFIIILSFSSRTTHSLSNVEALLKFKGSLSIPEVLNSWDPNTDPCLSWNGVVCLHGIVVSLKLKSMGLSGYIDVNALSDLKGLRTISLEDNDFDGPIPELNRLGALKAIYLTNNRFNSNISSDFFLRMESLKKLWLANNTFSGEIPSSLAQLRHLRELHLENNQFSGVIPPLKEPPLVSLDLSNNNLQGQIPMSLLDSKPSSFVGNPNLCGEIIGKECIAEIANKQSPPQPQPQTTQAATAGLSNVHKAHNSDHFVGVVATVLSVILVLLALVVVVILMTRNRKIYDDNIPTSKTNNNYNDEILSSDAIARTTTFTMGIRGSKNNVKEEGVVEVDVVEPVLRKDSSQSSSSSKRSNSDRSRRSTGRGGGGGGGSGHGDLTMVNNEKGVFGLADLMKASAEVLGNGALGSAYKAVMSNGIGVVVKRMRELNNMEKDAFDVEIRKLASLRHRNILPPLAYHYRNEEKLFVYEYLPKGSLHYILHGDRGISHEELNWPTRLKIIKGATEGLIYLHNQLKNYDLPHGNLKSSNIMIDSQNEPLLSDYGLSPMTNPNVRSHALFGYRSPEAIKHKTISPKCDVYCLGIVILEILTCKFPSQYLNSTKGGTDVVQWVASAIEEGREAELLDPDIVLQSTTCKESMLKVLHIGAACTEPNRDKRLSLGEVKERIERVAVEEGGGLDARTTIVL